MIMPNGARILDQLGVFETMRADFVTGMAKTYIRRSDGRLVTSNEWPKLVEKKSVRPIAPHDVGFERIRVLIGF